MALSAKANLKVFCFMSKLWHILKHEFLHLIGPTIFFFVAFIVIMFTRKLFLEDYNINFSGFFLTASIGALLVGKVVILTDEIPFMKRIPHVPLIYNVAWKSVIYSLSALVVQFLEEFLPRLWHHQSPAIAIAGVWGEVHWHHFWAVHILLSYFLMVYVSFRELARTFGEVQFFHLFFGLPGTVPVAKPLGDLTPNETDIFMRK
jgi:hypothetical protein